MRVADFRARADIVGHRASVSWSTRLDEGESMRDLPSVVVRRKRRDFEFPTSSDDDPFVVYDSAAFPPPDTNVVEIDLGTVRTATGTEAATTVLTAATSGADPFEITRRTRTVETMAGIPVAVTDTVLDVANRRQGLDSGTTYYYELVDRSDDERRLRAAATVTGTHGTASTLYHQLPAVHRRHDVVLPDRDRNTGEVPEALPANGQLRRFIDLVGAAGDHVRSRADGLRELHDVDDVHHERLENLAAGIGWELNTEHAIPLQRHEIRYAPMLYGLTGTVPGCLAWFKRLTGWDAELHEFWRNVMLTNDVGNPDDPDDHGSRTVDTDDPAVLAGMGRAGDTADYTYDTGTESDDWYAHNVVGFFATPGEDETIDEVVRKRSRVLTSVDRFLPCNLRAVVVLDLPVDVIESEPAFSLTTAVDEGV